MTEQERLKKQRELIELIGRRHEQEGFQPVAGRVFALLMVMDKEEYTFDEIVKEMNISKSSASTALKSLELRKRIEYVTYHGDRKRYFRLAVRDSEDMLLQFEKKLTEGHKLMNMILSLKKNRQSRGAYFAKRMSRDLMFMQKKIKEILSDYQQFRDVNQ